MPEKLKLKRDWIGRFVRLKQPLTNGAGVMFPENLIMKVTQNRGGLTLMMLDDCEHCGLSFQRIIAAVPEWKVELLPKDFRPKRPIVKIIYEE